MKKKVRENVPGGRRREKVKACSREPWVREVSKEGLNGIFIRCSDVSPMIGWHQGEGPLVTAAGPEVSHRVTLPGLPAFLGLGLKHTEAKCYPEGLMLKGVVIQRFVCGYSLPLLFQNSLLFQPVK